MCGYVNAIKKKGRTTGPILSSSVELDTVDVAFGGDRVGTLVGILVLRQNQTKALTEILGYNIQDGTKLVEVGEKAPRLAFRPPKRE